MSSQNLLKSIGMPTGDRYTLTSSNKFFSDNTAYRIEVPTINSIEALDKLLNEATKKGISINRVTETRGMFLHTRNELKEWVKLSSAYGCNLFMSIGPRATYDTSATVNTKDGFRIGYRLRGQDQLARGLEEILRGLELGISNFLLYDEGLLYAINKLKIINNLSNEIRCKLSAHCAYAKAKCSSQDIIGSDVLDHLGLVAATIDKLGIGKQRWVNVQLH